MRKLRAVRPGHVLYVVFRTLLIIGMSYVFLFPILYSFSVAIRDPATISDPSIVWLPKEFSLESIRGAIDNLQYVQSVLLTLLIAVCSTAGSLISCSLVGYGLARHQFAEKKLVFALVVLTIIVPPQTILTPTYMNFRFFDFGGILRLFEGITGVGYIDFTTMPLTPLMFILPSLFASGLRAGLFIFIFRQFFSGMPKDLDDAARIDGCGAFRIFLRVMLPLAVPAFITVMLFSFIWHWNDYYMSAMYFTGSLKPISVMLSNLVNSLSSNGMINPAIPMYQTRTYLAAGSLLTILPPLILYIFTQKYFTESIERTGIVG